MPAKTLHFVRHGEADYNLLNWVNAHAHVPNNLTATGREQAACCGQALAEIGIEIIAAGNLCCGYDKLAHGDFPSGCCCVEQ